VRRIDGVGNAFLINDDDNFGMEGDEILMRHAILLAIRQFQCERMKSIVKPFSDLLDYHVSNLSPGECESTPHGGIIFRP
jgi:hypothetical protein